LKTFSARKPVVERSAFERNEPVRSGNSGATASIADNRRTTRGFQDNRASATVLQRVEAAPRQFKKVADDHVAADLLHPQAERLFSAETIDWLNALPPKQKTTKALTSVVNAERDNIDYQQLRNTTLKNSQGLTSWLGKDALEHMYVHADGNIYTGGRDREKLPHPTLVGGDPDATCAGTMWWNNGTKTVTITNESGHFRPGSVASDTVEAVRSVFPKGKGYKVKKQEV